MLMMARDRPSPQYVLPPLREVLASSLLQSPNAVETGMSASLKD
jgi:hypothetical protein